MAHNKLMLKWVQIPNLFPWQKVVWPHQNYSAMTCKNTDKMEYGTCRALSMSRATKIFNITSFKMPRQNVDAFVMLKYFLSLMEWQLLLSRWILKIIVVERRQPRDNNYLEIERDTREEWKLGEKIKRHRRCRVIFFTQFSWLSSVEFNFVQNSSSRE